MTIITFLIVAIWWNPWALSQKYIDHTQKEIQQIEEAKK